MSKIDILQFKFCMNHKAEISSLHKTKE